MRRAYLLLAVLPALAAPLAAQRAVPRLEGEWEAKVQDGLHYIMVRADSSAQVGEQVARWRVVGDSLWLTVGDGAWQVYGMALTAERLTLSGGDLDQPVTLRRIGPAKPRAASVKIPAAPPDTARAW